MSAKDYNVIAFDLRVSAEKIKSIVEEFGLFVFTDDGKHFYSESLSARMGMRESKSEKARKAAKARWSKQNTINSKSEDKEKRNANAMQSHSERNALKESKVKESKEYIVGDHAHTPTPIVGRLKSHEDLKDQMKSHSEWKNTFAKNLGLSSVDVADKWIDRFVDHAIANGRGDDILFLREAKSYCLNWVRTRVKAGETPNSAIQKQEKFVLGKGRVIRHG